MSGQIASPVTSCRFSTGQGLQKPAFREIFSSMPAFLAPGDPAPDFSALAVGGSYQDGRRVTLADFKGKTLVLYFYPKDDTPGCTTQACALRDRYEHLATTGAELFGVSIDSPKSHRDFIDKHGLPFPLISDESHALVEAYGVWIEKNLYGKKSMGTERSTFVIGPDGRIKSVFRKVKPDEHVEAVLQDLSHFEP
jgi:peroxiredoxin Q/BCP